MFETARDSPAKRQSDNGAQGSGEVHAEKRDLHNGGYSLYLVDYTICFLIFSATCEKIVKRRKSEASNCG